MTSISTRNSIALAILQGPKGPGWVRGDMAVQDAPNNPDRKFGRGLPIESNGPMTVIAGKIAEIINEATTKGTFPGLQLPTPSAATAAYKPKDDEIAIILHPDGSRTIRDDSSPLDGATFTGGDGNDSVAANGRHTKVSTGAGNDSISTFNDAVVDSGSGDDTIHTYRRAAVSAGDGNDYISTYADSVVDAGAGNDSVRGNAGMTITAGAGNDEVRITDHGNVDAGDGDDFVVSHGHSTLRGGAGNDVITLTNTGATVTFNKGDGQDKISSTEHFTLEIKGYSKDDVVVTQDGDLTIISFTGSDDAIRMNMAYRPVQDRTATLSFEDGSTLNVQVARTESGGINLIKANPAWDWRNKELFYMDHENASVKLTAEGKKAY
jgi:hypothetical protein